MAEYIEREAVRGKAVYMHGFGKNKYVPLRAIEEAPAAAVAPVIRCKDCKHWKKGNFMGGDTPDSLEYGGGCPLVRFARYESDFCSKGERKDGE